jgi:tetratricopeptide (TPR) repeat protein
VLGTGALLILLLATWRRTRAGLTGWLFFLVAIAPTMGVVEFTNVVAADKYAYLPLLGFLLVLAAAAGRVWAARPGAPARPLRRAVVVTAALLCAGLETTATRADLAYWRDSVSLYRHMVRVSPNSALAHTNLGVALYQRGQVDEAIAEFRRGVAVSPRFHLPRFNLANVLAEHGHARDALVEYEELLKVCPDHFLGWDKRATLLIDVGRYSEALDCVDQMLRLRPDNAVAWNNKGWLLERLGRPAEARECYRRARQLGARP